MREPDARPGAARRRPTALIHCQYVYGIGHFVRTCELARGLGETFDVFILNGGETVPGYAVPPGVTCVQLPAIYKEEHLDHLSPVDPSLSLSECFEARAGRIERLLSQARPDVLITEHFPFGLLFEAEATWLIQRVKEHNPHAKIVSSVRDVIESKDGGRHDAHVCDLIHRFYDMVLVHGDPEVMPLSASFPRMGEIAVSLHHTGYVVQPPPPPAPRADPPALVVSVGGGRLGEELLHAALDAHRAVAAAWRHHLVLFAGAFQRDLGKLRARIDASEPSRVTLNEFGREPYRRALAGASAVICMGGYNTLLEAVATGLPTLVYQRTFQGNNTEQALRLSSFERAGLIRVLGPEELDPERMAARVLQLAGGHGASRAGIRMDGAAETSRRLTRLVFGETESV